MIAYGLRKRWSVGVPPHNGFAICERKCLLRDAHGRDPGDDVADEYTRCELDLHAPHLGEHPGDDL